MRLLLSGGGTGGHVYPILAVLEALGQGSPLPAGAAPPAALPLAAQATASKLPAPHEPTASAGELPGPSAPSPARPAPPANAEPAAPATASLDSASPAAAEQARTLRADRPEQLSLLYVGVAGSVEQELAARAGVPFQPIESGQVRGMAPWVAARNLLKAGHGVRQAGRLMAEFRPGVVFVTGGFVAGPVVLAAWRAGVPVFIYLPDVEPGLAIRRMSRFARSVGVTFPEVARWFPGKAVVTGYPVRQEILALVGQRSLARERLGLRADTPVLLVFGGSRGARSINQALADALPTLLPHCQVVHISGTLDWPTVERQAQSLPNELRPRYHAYPYLHDEMPLALAAADLVVARAGASTLGEFPALGLVSILAPYPYSGQHQEVNADYLAQRGAAIKLPDSELSEKLAPTVLRLLQNPAELAAMSQAARSLAQPAAAEAIGQELQRLAQTG